MAPRWNERDTFSDSEGKKTREAGGGGGGGPEAQQTSGDARWEITKHGGRFLRGIGSCMLLYVVPTVVQLCSSHSIQVVVD